MSPMPKHNRQPLRSVPAVEARQPDPIDVVVGQHLHTLRTKRGLSRKALAGICGISPQQIQKYETGTNRLSIARLRQFAAIFNVPLTRLMQGSSVSDQPIDEQAALIKRLTVASATLELGTLSVLTTLSEHLSRSD